MVPGEVLVHQSGPRLAPGGSSGQGLDRSAQGLVGGPQGGPAPGGNSSGRWESPRQCPTSGPQNNVVVKRLFTIRLLVSAQANEASSIVSIVGLSPGLNSLLE